MAAVLALNIISSASSTAEMDALSIDLMAEAGTPSAVMWAVHTVLSMVPRIPALKGSTVPLHLLPS